MATKQDRVRKKLLYVARNPGLKSRYHEDPDIGRVVKKLSQSDLQELGKHFPPEDKTVQASCPPGTG